VRRARSTSADIAGGHRPPLQKSQVQSARLFERGKESAECGVDGCYELPVFVEEILMVIESTHSGEKDLPAHSKRTTCGNDLDYLGQLLAKPAVWKRDRQRRSVMKCRRKELTCSVRIMVTTIWQGFDD
jgi:hypothetical protein